MPKRTIFERSLFLSIKTIACRATRGLDLARYMSSACRCLTTFFVTSLVKPLIPHAASSVAEHRQCCHLCQSREFFFVTDLATRASTFSGVRRKNKVIGIVARNFFCGENVKEALGMRRFARLLTGARGDVTGGWPHLTFVFVVVSRHYIAFFRFLYCNRKSDCRLLNACCMS